MESSSQIEQVAAVWLARRDGEDWTADDQAELARWLNAATAHRVAFIRLEAVWQQANRLKALGAGVNPGVVPPPGELRQSPFFSWPHSATAPAPPVSAREVTGGNGSMQGEARTVAWHPPRKLRYSIAASVLIAGIGLAWYKLLPIGPTYRTEVGGLTAVPMSDGSRVTLNTDSEIRVAVTQAERRVELTQGEAFFDVAKDPARPFVVRVGDTRVVAVGTKFSVRREDDDVRVVVTEGRVRLDSDSVAVAVPPAEISAGSIARRRAEGVLVQEKSLAEAEEILSWRSGYLVFKDTALADAVAEFNRYNSDKIVIEDASVAGIRIGGNFRSTNVEAFVRLLEGGFPVRVERRDDKIVLSQN